MGHKANNAADFARQDMIIAALEIAIDLRPMTAAQLASHLRMKMGFSGMMGMNVMVADVEAALEEMIADGYTEKNDGRYYNFD